MTIMENRFQHALLLAGALTLSGLGGCASIEPTAHYARTMQIPHIVGSALSIDTINGSIIADATDRADVLIEIDLAGNDMSRLLLATVHADRLEDNTLSIWVQWPDNKRKPNEGAAIAIEIPDANGIYARSTNGRILISGFSGDADLRSYNGMIRVERHDGSIYAETSNGALKAEHVSGDIEMYTSNGSIVVTDVFGPIRAETSNGNVYVSTMDGNEGPVRIRTSNGRVDLDLGDGFDGILKCETSNGKISVSGLDEARLIESSKNTIELRIGDSDEVSAVRTNNGSVRVRGAHTEPTGG